MAKQCLSGFGFGDCSTPEPHPAIDAVRWFVATGEFQSKVSLSISMAVYIVRCVYDESYVLCSSCGVREYVVQGVRSKRGNFKDYDLCIDALLRLID
jgi:hypothetical protein